MITVLSIVLLVVCFVAPFLLFGWALSILSRMLGVDLSPGKSSSPTQRRITVEDEVVRAQWRYDNIFKGGKR
jgi:hypothetical protein